MDNNIDNMETNNNVTSNAKSDVTGISVEFETLLGEKDLVDFKLYHYYHSFSGIATVIFGLICFFICGVSFNNYNMAYTLMMAFFGLFFTIYTPIGIKTKVRRQMKASQSLSDPVKYTVTENKITLSQGDIHEELLWEEVYKLKATPKCVILYLSAVRANVIPCKCLGDKAESFVRIAEKKLSPFQIKMDKKKVIEKCRQEADRR